MINSFESDTIARSRDELDRPGVLTQLLEPFTRQLFIEAGISPGMRVLDVCSGAGDVAFLVREIVGPGGHVVGFDTSPNAVSYANDRAAFRDFRNVKFVQADLEDLPFGADFDAVVGRKVLAYRRDPVRDLRALTRCMKPGGLLVFQEFDHSSGRTIPSAPAVEEARKWFLEAFERAGIDSQMGLKLHAIFQDAGLEPPRMRLDGLIGGAESVAAMMMPGLVHTLLPALEELEVATEEEVQVDALEDRIRMDLMRTGGILQTSLLIGAWARLPD